MQHQGRGLGYSGAPAQQLEHALVKGAAPIGGDRRAGRAHGSENMPWLNLNHFKIFFARTAFGASPVHGHILPSGSGRNAFVWGASGFVINPAANQTHPSFSHSQAFKVQGEKVGGWPRGLA